MGIPQHLEYFAVATAASSGFFPTSPVTPVDLDGRSFHLAGGEALPPGYFSDLGLSQTKIDRLGGVGRILATLDFADRPRARRFVPFVGITLKNCSVLEPSTLGEARALVDKAGPLQCLTLPLHDAGGEAVDAVGWNAARPDLWHRRNGLGCLLGRDDLREAQHSGLTLEVHMTPKDWLLGGLYGACLLDFSAASELRGVRAIRCQAPEWYARQLSNAITRAGLRIPVYNNVKASGGFGLSSEPRLESSANWSRGEVLGEFRNCTRRCGRGR